jgi:tetratricopeptide (TPR) repeat protein
MKPLGRVMKGPSKFCGSSLVLCFAVTLEAAAPVTFYRDIAPIVHRNCSPCHKPGEAAPFPLITYEHVKAHARQIAAVTARRYMPPWLPEGGYGEFVEDRRLSDAQVRLIGEWVKQGAIAGVPAQPLSTSPDANSGWKLGKPDLELHVRQPYQLSAEGPEVFWNFVIPVPLAATRWVKAVEIRPGALKVVHHASILVDRTANVRKHEKIPGAGFPGMDVSIDESTFDPDGVFLAWKPGSTPHVEPEGIAWRADPGTYLVFSVHLRPSGKPETVDPVIALYFTDKPQTRFPMLVALERDGSIDIPAGERDYVVTDSFRCPIDVQVLAVYPHAHYLGKRLEGYATLPDGSRKWLIRIPEWDLNWQGVFYYKTPVALPRGSLITMLFHYDNSAGNLRNPHNPPRRVLGGNQADDEMGNLWLQLLPAGEGDQRAVIFEALMRQRLERSPGDFLASYNLGEMLLNAGQAAEAVPFFEAAWKGQPVNVVAATELGVALMSAQRIAEAKLQFQRALQIDPRFTDARYDLASAYAAGEEWEDAAREFAGVIKERPAEVRALEHLGEVLMLWGDQFAGFGNFSEAAKRYDNAVLIRPSDPDLRVNFGNVLVKLGRFDKARVQFEAALRIAPDHPAARQALAALEREAQSREAPR